MLQIPIQIHRYIGLIASAPTGVPIGSTLYDYATGIMHITYDGTNWAEKDTIVRLEAGADIDIGKVEIMDSAGLEVLGKLTESPTTYSIADRLKSLLTNIVLKAGTALIGKVGIDQVTSNANEVVVKSITAGDNNIGNVDIASITAGDTVIGKVELVSADDSTITDDTANAVKAYLVAAAGGDAIGEVQDTPTAYTLLRRLKDIATAAGLLYTGPPDNVSTTELGSADNFLAAAGKLYWLTFTNEAGSASFCTLNDATSGTGSRKSTLYQPSESSFTHVFNPPMAFATGIRMGAASAQVKVTAGWIADA